MNLLSFIIQQALEAVGEGVDSSGQLLNIQRSLNPNPVPGISDPDQLHLLSQAPDPKNITLYKTGKLEANPKQEGHEGDPQDD